MVFSLAFFFQSVFRNTRSQARHKKAPAEPFFDLRLVEGLLALRFGLVRRPATSIKEQGQQAIPPRDSLSNGKIIN